MYFPLYKSRHLDVDYLLVFYVDTEREGSSNVTERE